jgi:hypothetical protein
MITVRRLEEAAVDFLAELVFLEDLVLRGNVRVARAHGRGQGNRVRTGEAETLSLTRKHFACKRGASHSATT